MGMGIGDWGLGVWGLGAIPKTPTPTPKPQKKIFFFYKKIILKIFFIF